MRAGRCCRREPELLIAFRRGALSDEQRAHLATCRSCVLATLAEEALRHTVAERPATEALLPDPAVLQLRAAAARRRAAAERALQPLHAARWAGAAVAAGTLVALGPRLVDALPGGRLELPSFGLATIGTPGLLSLGALVLSALVVALLLASEQA